MLPLPGTSIEMEDPNCRHCIPQWGVGSLAIETVEMLVKNFSLRRFQRRLTSQSTLQYTVNSTFSDLQYSRFGLHLNVFLFLYLLYGRTATALHRKTICVLHLILLHFGVKHTYYKTRETLSRRAQMSVVWHVEPCCHV